MKFRKLTRAIALGCTLALVLSGPALAAPIVMVDVLGGSEGIVVNQLGTGVQNGDVLDWSLDAPLSTEGLQVNSWTASFKEDPFVTNNFSGTNLSGGTQTIIMTVLLPIPAFAYNQIVNSSFGVSVTDSNGVGGLSLSESGGVTFFQGLVNGTSALNLSGGVPLTEADCLPFVSPGCTATTQDGVAAQAAAGLATEIGLTIRFDLSAGDSAAVTSRFEIIPEPALAALLGLGALVIARQRKTR